MELPAASPDRLPRFESLSDRERETLRLAATGSTNKEIGEQLGLTVYAVKFHLASIYRKLGVANRTEAAVAFVNATSDQSPGHLVTTREGSG